MDEGEEAVRRKGPGSVGIGIALAALLHLVFVPLIGYLLSIYAPYSGISFALGIGLSQLVYLGPATWILYRRGKPDTAKGVGIGAAVTFLLNAACFGVVALDPLVH